MSVLLAVLACTSAVIDLYPQPQKAEIQDKGAFSLDGGLTVVVEEATPETKAMLAPLFDALGFEPSLVAASQFKPGERALYIGVLGKHGSFDHYKLKRYLPDIAKFGGQAYTLRIWKKGILVAGVGRAGMSYGIHTLVQLILKARENGVEYRGKPALPFTNITDYPDLSLRGAYLYGPITENQVRMFAALKCGMLVFESDDFYVMDDAATALWQPLFQQVRDAGIVPVPVLEFLHVPGSFLLESPAAVEGRSRVDKIQLSDTEWKGLARGSTIVTPENPLRVTLENMLLRPEEDYEVSETVSSLSTGGEDVPCLQLRRKSGGSISADDVVDVTYSYAPPGSNALCPHAPEAERLYRGALDRLIRTLNPEFMHCGFGDIGRINQDLRCRDKKITNAEAVAAAIRMVHRICAEIQPGIRLIISADAFLPAASDGGDDSSCLHAALESIPESSLAICRYANPNPGFVTVMERSLQRLQEQGLCPMLTVTNPAAGYNAVTRLAASDAQERGVLVVGANPEDPETRTVLEKAWTNSSHVLPWPEYFNGFFGVSFLEPGFEEVKSCIIQYVERQVLSGIAPKDIRKKFEDYCESRSYGQWMKKEESPSVSSLLDIVTRYLDLEYEYTKGNKRSALRDLVALVKEYDTLDDSVDAERNSQILDTIKNQSLFVPASILFGWPVTYYRPFTPPSDSEPGELSAQLRYDDAEATVQATLDYLVGSGPVYRIDFEAVNARAATVSVSEDGETFNEVAAKPALSGETLRGPLFLSAAVTTRFLRLRVDASDAKPVLRDVRTFLLREPARARCLLSNENTGRTGMLFNEAGRPATAPTEIWLSRNLEGMELQIKARDPLPHAVGASMTGADMPLWEEESVEIRIQAPDKPGRRFLVNPLGARHDAIAVAAGLECWDQGWDGVWNADIKSDELGWSAIIRLPFSILGGIPNPGESWKINFLRHRNNVEKESSAWAPSLPSGLPGYGVVSFE